MVTPWQKNITINTTVTRRDEKFNISDMILKTDRLSQTKYTAEVSTWCCPTRTKLDVHVDAQCSNALCTQCSWNYTAGTQNPRTDITQYLITFGVQGMAHTLSGFNSNWNISLGFVFAIKELLSYVADKITLVLENNMDCWKSLECAVGQSYHWNYTLPLLLMLLSWVMRYFLHPYRWVMNELSLQEIHKQSTDFTRVVINVMNIVSVYPD